MEEKKIDGIIDPDDDLMSTDDLLLAHHRQSVPNFYDLEESGTPILPHKDYRN